MKISRRAILAGLSATALANPASAFWHGVAAVAPFVFQGNPNVTTSSVDVATNGIVRAANQRHNALLHSGFGQRSSLHWHKFKWKSGSAV